MVENSLNLASEQVLVASDMFLSLWKDKKNLVVFPVFKLSGKLNEIMEVDGMHLQAGISSI